MSALHTQPQQAFMLISLMQVCQAAVRLIKTAEPADLCDLLEICADLFWHPGEEFLGQVQERLTAAAADQMPLVSICTSLWAYATFAYVPSILMQRAYANRIEQDLDQLNSFQICSLLWVYALFKTCTQGVWNTLVGRLTQSDLQDIDEGALKLLYQVLLSAASVLMHLQT